MHEGRIIHDRGSTAKYSHSIEADGGAEFLCEAAILVTDVKAILSDRGYVATVDRIKEIEGRLVREMLAMERLIEASTPGLYH